MEMLRALYSVEAMVWTMAQSKVCLMDFLKETWKATTTEKTKGICLVSSLPLYLVAVKVERKVETMVPKMGNQRALSKEYLKVDLKGYLKATHWVLMMKKERSMAK